MQPEQTPNLFSFTQQPQQQIPKNVPSPQQKQQQQQNNIQNEDDDDDFDDLGLFHKSSLHNKEQLTLPEIVPEIYNVKRFTDENNQNIIKDYIEMQKLGNGAFAEVKKVMQNSQVYAMKIYQLMRLKSKKFYAADGNFADSEEMFRNEIQILKRLTHQNLVKCHEILYGGNYAYLVMELCELGQIMDWSQPKNDFIRNEKVLNYLSQKYSLTKLEDITRLIFIQLALGLQYLHSHNISNRDIKVDNILCHRSNVQGDDIKIADFTTVRYSQDDISYFTCGTAGFRPPEVQNAGSQGYSCKAMDIWSFGISMYTYYFEKFPFMDESQYAIQMRAEKEQLSFQEGCPHWLQEVITKTTHKNHKERANIDEVIKILTIQ